MATHRITYSTFAIVFMAALFCTVPVIAQETFTIIDLGTLGGSVSFAYGVNDQGDAVGDSSLLGDFSSHAFLWREGKMIDLGTLTDAHDISIAFAINNSGQVVGQSFNSAVGNTLPFVWENGVMTALPLLPGHLGGAAFGINSHGDVVGQSGGEAVLWVNGVVTRLTSGYFASTAYGINDRSQIVGVANPPDTEAVIWENGVMTPLSPPVLEGCHGDCWTVARAINELGDISGYVQGMRDPPARAVRWTNGIPTVLDALLERDSLIHLGSIDEVGDIVGTSHSFVPMDRLVPTLWSAGVPHALPTLHPGDNQGQAIGISDRGHIIAGALLTVSPYDLHAVLWTPTTSSGDMTPPTLLLPATIVVDATSPAGATVTYSVSASDDRDPNPVVICSPPSGNVFPLLVTNVSCAATDDAGNSASGTFQVVVLDATQQLQQTIDVVASYALTRLGTSLSDKLQLAMGFSASADVRQACGVLTGFLNEVRAQSGKALSVEQATELTRRGIRIRNVIGC